MNYLENPQIIDILNSGGDLLKLKYYSELIGTTFCFLILLSISLFMLVSVLRLCYIVIEDYLKKRKENLEKEKLLKEKQKLKEKQREYIKSYIAQNGDVISISEEEIDYYSPNELIKKIEKAKADKEIIDLNNKIEFLFNKLKEEQGRNDK